MALWLRAPAAGAAVLGALVLLVCLAFQGTGPIALLGSSRGAITDNWGVHSAATRAVEKLESSVKKMRYLRDPHAAAIASEMAKALHTVSSINKGPTVPKKAAAENLHRGRHAAALLAKVKSKSVPAAKEAAAANIAKRIASKKIGTAAVPGALGGLAMKLSKEDSMQVQSELAKLEDTADSLNMEMRKLKREHRLEGTGEVARRAKAVALGAKHVKVAADKLVYNKKQVVAHELAVANNKLREAKIEERAARKASREAVAAEKLAASKRAVAAHDEKIAGERRAAARRARAIAAKGSILDIKKAMKAEEIKEEQIAKKFHKEEKKAREEAAAKRRAMEKKEEAADHAEDKEPSVSETTPKQVRSCTDEIAQLGCEALPFGSECLKFCGQAGHNAAKHERADGGKGVGEGAVNPRSYAVHDRTGYFVGHSGQDTYLDSVFGGAPAPPVLLHSGKDFFEQHGGDIESNGHDLGREQATQGLNPETAVLHKEQVMAQQLEDALAQARVENSRLRRTVQRQAHTVHSVSFVNDGADEGTVESDAIPPLPAYAAKTQALSEMPDTGLPGGQRAVAGSLMLHNINDDLGGSSFDPMRP